MAGFGNRLPAGHDERFRFAVLKQIAGEPSTEARLAYIQLLNEEGSRERSIAEAKIHTQGEVEARRLDIQMADDQAKTGILHETIAADSMDDERRARGLMHASWRFSITAVAPAVFAMLVTVFMFLFWKWHQPEAAGAFEKILVLVITGGLGWAAGRAQGTGGQRSEDHRAPPGKAGQRP